MSRGLLFLDTVYNVSLGLYHLNVLISSQSVRLQLSAASLFTLIFCLWKNCQKIFLTEKCGLKMLNISLKTQFRGNSKRKIKISSIQNSFRRKFNLMQLNYIVLYLNAE